MMIHLGLGEPSSASRDNPEKYLITLLLLFLPKRPTPSSTTRDQRSCIFTSPPVNAGSSQLWFVYAGCLHLTQCTCPFPSFRLRWSLPVIIRTTASALSLGHQHLFHPIMCLSPASSPKMQQPTANSTLQSLVPPNTALG